MTRYFTLPLALLALLLWSATPVSSLRAQPTAPTFEAQNLLSGATEVKFPHLAATPGQVHLASNVNRADAAYWSKGATATTFGAAQALGAAEGQPDYSTTSLTTGPEGTLYYVWVNQGTRTISLRTKPVNQDWRPAVTVAQGQPFPVFPEVAISSDGIITVVWRNPDRPFVYRRSSDGGASWGPVTPFSEGAAFNVASIASGPDGKLAVAYTQGTGDRLQIFVGVWNGSGFTTQRITSFNGDYADPSVSYSPDGRLYVAWRGIAEAGSSSGVFFAEQQPNGTWPVARLVGGKVAGKVSILADESNNLHLLWTGMGSGDYQLWYSRRPAMGSWSTPIAAPRAAGTIFNASAAVAPDTDGTLYAHAASEVFYGSSVYLRTYRFSTGLRATRTVAAAPVLDEGAPMTHQDTVAVSFREVEGSPTQVRYRWGSAPTEADPWVPFASTVSVPVPAAFGVRACEALTLYAQVRNESSEQVTPASDEITIDRGVQATVSTLAQLGAPGYTSSGVATWLIEDAGECSGFDEARTDVDGATSHAIPITPATLPFNLPSVEGRYTRTLTVTDALGNSDAYTRTFVYDATPPILGVSAPLTVTASPQATILHTLRLKGASYADASGAAPWGAAIAMSRSPIAEQELAAGDLTWVVLPLDAAQLTVASDETSAASSTISARIEVSLASFVPRSTLQPGTYYYALALLDQAGNRSREMATGAITLSEITYPRLALPLLWK